MKKYLIIISLIIICNSAMSQYMRVHTNGTVVNYPINKVDSVTFFISDTSVMDIEGNIYKAVLIGNQVWMAENLKVTKYRNGEPIGTTSPYLNITSEIEPRYQWAYEGNENNVAIYGRLYTWYALTDNRGVCPTGWHMASDLEWTTLENYLISNGFNYDGTLTENKIAKVLASTSYWNSSTVEGAAGNSDYPKKRNLTGFNAIPNGLRSSSGGFHYLNESPFWWTATENYVTSAWCKGMYYGAVNIYNNDFDKKNGAAVRCIKD
jgi:uncharacterized protein (TIGR02145 family)